MPLFDLATLEDAATIVHRVIPPTPQIHWPLLSERVDADVWVKHENHTSIGAFKLRGGILYMERLAQRQSHVAGVIAATRGNHGQSVAFAASRAALPAIIVVPHGNSKEKNASIRAFGAELVEQGQDFQDALEYATKLATERQLHFVPAFDETLVCGVASYALELFQEISNLDAVYVPIGLGSGICGTIAVRDALGLKTEIVGVVAQGAPAYARSFEAGRMIATESAQTIADGIACRVPNERALSIVRAGASRIVTVDDNEIRRAMQHLFTDTHNVAEGAGAAAFAGLLQERSRMRGKRVAVVLSGGNVDREVFIQCLAP